MDPTLQSGGGGEGGGGQCDSPLAMEGAMHLADGGRRERGGSPTSGSWEGRHLTLGRKQRGREVHLTTDKGREDGTSSGGGGKEGVHT
jgi:hypothetical protein